MNKYLVKLTPQGKYFFGGDMKFSSGEGKDNPFVSYIIESFKTPQQTSLLGMLRFLMLSNEEKVFDRAGNHIIDKEAADKLIGKSSFAVNEDKSSNEFGEILSIGSCSIYDKVCDKFYFRAARGHELSVDFSTTDIVVVNGVNRAIPKMEGYNPKNSLEDAYISEDGHVLSGKKLPFIEDSRIGINKDYEGKTKDNEDAFYKQISYRLAKDFCFALEVETKDVDLSRYSGSIVKLGADDSSFLFEAEEGGLTYPQDEGKGLRVVLLSDAYLPETPDYVRFAITDVRPFRFLHSNNSTKASDYNVKYRKFRSKERYDLYQAGSVFYFENEEGRAKFCELLNSFKDFVQIGYNRYYGYNKTI